MEDREPQSHWMSSQFLFIEKMEEGQRKRGRRYDNMKESKGEEEEVARAEDMGSKKIRILTHRLHPSLMNVAKGFSVSLSPMYAGHEQDCCTK